MFLDPVEAEDVVGITKRLKPKLRYRPDEISSKFLMNKINEISIQSSETGIFSDGLKCAEVFRIYIVSDPTEINNFRHVSLYSAFSTLIERIVCNKLMEYFTFHNLLYEH